MDKNISRGRFALRCALMHLTINIVIATIVACLVFFVWYPTPYAEMLGGLNILGLIIAIDVVCGPVLTSILATPKKSRRALMTDFSIVAMVQLAALAYGLHTIMLARPVYSQFDSDRIIVVSAADIDPEALKKVPEQWRNLPLWGVKRISVRQPKNDEEKLKSIELSMNGQPPIVRPDWWQPENPADLVKLKKVMRPVAQLVKHYPNDSELTAAIQKTQIPENELFFLPFVSTQALDWTVLLDKNGAPKGYIHRDAFFN